MVLDLKFNHIPGCMNTITKTGSVGVPANSARARFIRLTDAVEQLRQRAAVDVRQGHEANARLLLVEKQKVMKALEAARRRAELLEQLAGKLNLVSNF